VRGRTLLTSFLVAGLVVVLVVVLERPSTPQPSSGQSTSSMTLPLTSASSSTSESSVVLAMGHLDDPTNTFWELFVRSASDSSWRLRTPPGVADNGGLILATSAVGSFTAGILPSLHLTFSPLAQSMSGGQAWSPGHFPTGLAVAPNALASASSGALFAVGSNDGGSLYASEGIASSWKRVITSRSLASSVKGCTVRSITAVTLSSSGKPILGLSCSSGARLGVVTASQAPPATGSWRTIGPSLGGDPGVTSVLRLEATADGITGLATITSKTHTESLVAVWGQGAAPLWEQSQRRALPAGWAIASTSVGPSGQDQQVAALLRSGAKRQIVEVDRGSKAWSELPSPPANTEAITTLASEIDAFVVSGSRLSIWTLPKGASTWHKAEGVVVPLQYGSSS